MAFFVFRPRAARQSNLRAVSVCGFTHEVFSFSLK